MTFVIARRFGDRIVLGADMMISDEADRPNIIPGRLKAIILSQFVTVAYAGAANQGLDAVRRASHVLRRGGTLEEVERILIEATSALVGKLEFVLVDHTDGPSLRRVWDGKISANLQRTSIGDRVLEDHVDQLIADMARETGFPPDSMEMFSGALGRMSQSIQVSKTVGGTFIVMGASPVGHNYWPVGGVATWDTITMGEGITDHHLRDRQSGMTQWQYHVNGPRQYGVGVVGTLFLDAGIGYVHSPLQTDDAMVWRFAPPATSADQPPVLKAFQGAIDATALRVGGGVEVPPAPRRSFPPTPSEMEEIIAYAERARLSVGVTLHADHLSVATSSGGISSNRRVEFASLEDDAVAAMIAVIDQCVGQTENMARNARSG